MSVLSDFSHSVERWEACVGDEISDMGRCSATDRKWYVLRDLKRANAKKTAYRALQELQEPEIRVFTPMRRRLVRSGGRSVLEEVPFVPDLLFVYGCRQVIDPLVAAIPKLQYCFARGGGQGVPMVVPDGDMNRFMRAVKSFSSYQLFSIEEITHPCVGEKSA